MHSLPLFPLAEGKRDSAGMCGTGTNSVKEILFPFRIIKSKRTVQGHMRVPFPITPGIELLYDEAGDFLYPPPGPGKPDLDKIGIIHVIFARRYRFIGGRELKCCPGWYEIRGAIGPGSDAKSAKCHNHNIKDFRNQREIKRAVHLLFEMVPAQKMPHTKKKCS
jgi:hypothetical protein